MAVKVANESIKSRLKTLKIPYWRIAEVLGVHENTILRHLRTEMTSEELSSFEKAIDEILAQMKNGGE